MRSRFLFLLAWPVLSACGGESNPYVSGDGRGGGPDAAAEVLDAAGDMEAGDLPAGDARGDAFTIWPVDGWEDVALEPVQPELRVRITVPGPAPGLAVSAGSLGEGAPPPQVVLGGLVLGGPESLEVITDAGYQAAIPLGEGPYFSAPVPLSAPVRSGDSWIAAPTVVTVRAVRGGLAVSDSVQLVANPGFDLRGNLVPVPDVLFNDEPTEVRFFLDLSHAGGFDADGVYLQPMDATCTEKLPGASRKLRDDGDLETSSDEVAGDGVFTQRLYVSGVADTVLLYRAALTAQTAGGELVVFGPCMGIRVVPRIHKATCNTALLVLEKGAQGARHFREDGDDAATAARKTLVWLRTLGGVAESGAAEGGDLVWVRFTSGILGAIPLGDEAEALGVDPEFPVIGTSAAAAVVPASRQVFLEAPGGEELALAATLDGRGCPGLRVSPRGALAEDSDRLGDHGVQLWENGGGLAFGGLSDEARDAHGWALAGTDRVVWDGWRHGGAQEVAWTTVSATAACDGLADYVDPCYKLPDGSCCVDCLAEPPIHCPGHLECLPQKSSEAGTPMGFLYDRYQADLATGRLVLGPERWGVTPAWFGRYARGNGGGRLVWLGFPSSLRTGAAALELLAAGVDTVAGFPGPASPAQQVAGGDLLEALVDRAVTPSALLLRLDQAPEAGIAYLGAGAVDLWSRGLLNAGFGQGAGLMGWEHTGDARTLPGWCGMEAVDQDVALLSTGIGYTVQTGEISQRFCLPADKSLLSVSWSMISYEWMESCGADLYQDRFQVFLEDGEGGVLTVLEVGEKDYVEINHFCACDAEGCTDCGQCGSPNCQCGALVGEEPGLQLQPWPETCAFGDGDAFHTGWRTSAEVNVTAFAGLDRPVRLVMRVSDQGAAWGDSTVLVDGLILE